jgi:CRP-like cAMP-binding protein
MQGRHRNWLLSSVEVENLVDFGARLTPIELRRGEELHSPSDAVEYVYFPDGALMGVLSETLTGEIVVTGMIGFDGALGVFEACGSRKAHMRGVVLVAGAAHRMRASDYRALYDASPGLRTAVHKHVEVLLAESRQSVGCNAIHPVEGRLARTLLEATERCDGANVVALTQENLAQMLGVQRTTIAVAMSSLQKQGSLRSGRGAVELNQDALEKTACSCREILQMMKVEIRTTRAESCDA